MSSDTSGKPTITGLVLTYNGERLLGKCLESLAFCDAVIVVDSFSSDATESIAREHGATFVQHPWSGALPQFEYALGLVETDWVVSLDQDEICTPGTAGIHPQGRGRARRKTSASTCRAARGIMTAS